jgi:23S rRNA (uracil1939-C5)-methyltransferase
MENGALQCRYAGKCGGCPSFAGDFAPERKAGALRELFALAEIRYAPTGRVRDRADLTCENINGQMRIGLYGLNLREVVDLDGCPMMSEPLEAWFKEFRLRPPPIQKGSVRLRVSPGGERGVWLDFANQDVKRLFDEKSYLQWLSERAFVEIGQRRKALIWKDGQPKLVDPILKPWFETYDAQNRPLPLYGPVGGFSQVGFAANRALVGAVSELAEQSGVRDWLELFCGNGNFALALASRGHRVEAVELDPLAVAGLELARGEYPLKILRQDVYLQAKKIPKLADRGLLVDPPRAGLREVLALLAETEPPRALLYVSCFAESFLADSAHLRTLGFHIRNILGVDQFPFSPHMEWIALFQRD